MDLSPADLDHLGRQVVDFINRYLTTLEDQPVLGQNLDLASLRRLLEEPLPRQPQGAETAFQDFVTKIAANSRRVGHPRFLGWVRPSVLSVPVYAEALAAALNQSVAVWDGAPAASEVELRVIDWLKEMCGFDPAGGGILTSGGSMANFVCLLAARSHLDPEVREVGLFGQAPMTVYATSETHFCIRKAAEMMGLGRQQVRMVPTDAQFRMDPAALAQAIDADIAAGFRPLAAAATIGTVNSGACDDLPALLQVCRSRSVWLHVDGAYGGLSGLVPLSRHLSRGLDEVDSLAFDPHKTLFVPFEAGCALVRRPSDLASAFQVEADYLPNTNPHASQAVHFRDFGPQLSRSFRALKIYLTLKTYGVDAVAAATARLYALASDLTEQIQASPDFELLAPVTLGIVAFRYTGTETDPTRLDELNAGLIAEVQHRGRVFFSGTRLGGVQALRVCFVSHRTTEVDLPVILDEVRAAAASMTG